MCREIKFRFWNNVKDNPTKSKMFYLKAVKPLSF